MKVREIDHGLILAAPEIDAAKRSEGVHASDLYGALYKKLQPDRYDKRNPDGSEQGFVLEHLEDGMSFEGLVERIMAERLLGARPPEMRSPHEAGCPLKGTKIPEGKVCPCGGGIYYSPDYLMDVDGEMVLGEFKRTSMSTKGAPDDRKFDKYRAQLKLYCYWLEIDVARLYVYFINGDWKTFKPVLRAWEYSFTEKDLATNYNMVTRYARTQGILPKQGVTE